jgi:Carbohydrate family 9 binding domain-like
LVGTLLLASLACGAGGTDVQATVNAVNTAVDLTLSAMTPASDHTALPPTPAPTIGIATARPTTFVPPPKATATLPPPPGPSLTPAAQIRPNGTLLHASHRSKPPTINAQPADWGSPLPYAIDQIVFGAANWTGPADLSGSFGLGWDANNLYLLVVIVDDVHVQTQHGELMFKGDSLELQFDADLPGDFAATTNDADDYQLGLSPGANRDAPEAFLWNPADRKGVPSGLVMATRATDPAGGYVFETAIPWALFGVTPSAGQVFGMALNSSSNDNPGTAIQQSMVSSVATRKLFDPTSWGTVQLDP